MTFNYRNILINYREGAGVKGIPVIVHHFLPIESVEAEILLMEELRINWQYERHTNGLKNDFQRMTRCSSVITIFITPHM